MDVREVEVRSILTRASGYLDGVSSHSLQPYRGCSFGNSLCGVGCYVQHNRWVTQGRPWGSFLDVRVNAAESYRARAPGERRWARAHRGAFGIFLSSATDPFLPQEARYGVTARLLAAMRAEPPDVLIVQTHAAAVAGHADALAALAARCDVRVHVSIETDRERMPGLPGPASSVADRIEAARALRARGLRVVATVAPLLPIDRPEPFFDTLGEAFDGVVIDHFIGGDGSRGGSRTRRTALPAAMEALHPGATGLAYRDEIVEIARRRLPGRVGVGPDGFAGRFLPADGCVP